MSTLIRCNINMASQPINDWFKQTNKKITFFVFVVVVGLSSHLINRLFSTIIYLNYDCLANTNVPTNSMP